VSDRHAVADATDVPERVLAAADECFQRYGIAKTTMEDVARAANISRATLYRYFSDRESLLTESVRRRARRGAGQGHAGQGGVGDPVGDGPGLAGARAGQHAHGPAGGQGHLALFGIQRVQYRVRVGHPYRSVALRGRAASQPVSSSLTSSGRSCWTQ